MPLSSALIEIPAQSGVGITLARGDTLRIIDRCGEQVADLAIFTQMDVAESFSSGRTIDYNESLSVGIGDVLFSNRSSELARVVEDTVGVHDMLLAPCSEAMFARRSLLSHPSCHANLVGALLRFGVCSDMVSATINVFMNVQVTTTGRIVIREPASRSGDCFSIEALQDLIIGVTACASERTNSGHCKPIFYEVLSG